MDGKKITTAIFALFCVLLLTGEVLAYFSPACHYNANIEKTEDGFSYSFESEPSAEFNLVLIDNGLSDIIEKLYIYYDSAYGYTSILPEDFLKNFRNHLRDNGFTNYEVIDTNRLMQILSEVPDKIGLLIFTGAIPEPAFDGALLNWIKSGGTLYWTYGILGAYIAKSNGTTELAPASMEPEYLGTFCTNWADIYTKTYGNSIDLSKSLRLMNNRLYGAIDLTQLTLPHVAIGFSENNLSEITLITQGAGSICIMSGLGDQFQEYDLIQCICAQITHSSTLCTSISKTLNHNQTYSSDLTWEKIPGHKYIGYVFITATVPVYGMTSVINA